MSCLICGAAHTSCGPKTTTMGITIKQPAGNPSWTSDRRIYLDAAGNVVEANDPNKLTLLVAAGGTMPLAEAKRLGLVAPEPAESAEAPQGDAPEGLAVKLAPTGKGKRKDK